MFMPNYNDSVLLAKVVSSSLYCIECNIRKPNGQKQNYLFLSSVLVFIYAMQLKNKICFRDKYLKKLKCRELAKSTIGTVFGVIGLNSQDANLLYPH